MLNFVKKLLNKKNPLIKNKSKDSIEQDNPSAPCSLEIQMNLDGTVNIICSWPEFDDHNKKIMSHLANNYAIMIDALNTGFLSKEIINTLKNYQTDNPMDILFAQNVFYKIAEINYLKNQNSSGSDTLIKPSEVFRKLS
jgi:hypothetical protein